MSTQCGDIATEGGDTLNKDMATSGEFFTITNQLTKTLVLISGSCPQ